jgi:hypothetical protein
VTRLVVVGSDPRTALGQAVARLATPVEEVDASVAEARPDGRSLLIGAAADGPLELARRAADAGWAVLLEPVVSGGAAGLAELAAATAPGAIAPALRRRHEPDVRWARAAVGRGALGLPWGVHAEALESRAPDALTDALDLADAIEQVAGVRLRSAVRLDRDRHVVLASMACEEGVIAQVAARVSDRGPDSAEMASLRLTGSHGTLLADLDAPAIETSGPAAGGRSRLGRDGADRLLSGFMDPADGAKGGDLASLESAARLLALLEGRRPSKAGA